MALPHEYVLEDTQRESEVRTALAGRTDGGGSVTMPLKLTTMPWMQDLGSSARVIGALNTIVRTDSALPMLQHSAIMNVLGDAAVTKAGPRDELQLPFFGFNTDWIGIAVPVSAALRDRDGSA